MTKAKIIAHQPTMTFKSLFMSFAGTFATLWLFVEPLGMFGLIKTNSFHSGLTSYLALIVTSVIISFFLSKSFSYFVSRKGEFVTYTLESSSDGKDHLLKSPKNIQIYDLTILLIDYLKTGEAKERIESMNFHYTPFLCMKEGDSYIELDESLTLVESGVTDKAVLFIKGKPREHTVKYSMTLRPEIR